MDKLIISAAEAAKILGTSPNAVQAALKRGRLGPIRKDVIGRSLRLC